MKRAALFGIVVLMAFGLSMPVTGQNSPAGSPLADTGMITFRVDLSQWAARGLFDPLTDSLDMPGTMNGDSGSLLLQKTDTTMVYSIGLKLAAGSTQRFRFRINRDTNNMETVNRFYRVPADTTSVTYMYNDYDTSTVPVTFRCHMMYQIRAHHFNPLPMHDYLDVAGTFNGNGAYDLLYDTEGDSIYRLTMHLPRTLISPVVPLAFKFRINGDWNTSEFMNGTGYRTCFLQDTAGGVMNVVDVWYDNIDPTVPATPFASNVYIQGRYAARQALTGAYSYEDHNLRPEGNSLYRWYIADSITQITLTPIGDSTINYVVDSLNAGKYIAFEVTPIAAGTGDSLTGKPVMVWTGKIGAVGIGNLQTGHIRIYPNPATTEIVLEGVETIREINILSITGQNARTVFPNHSQRITLNIQDLGTGIYLVKLTGNDGTVILRKFVKN